MDIELLAGTKADRETSKAIQACNDYLRMGPGRSQAKLLERYQGATEAPPVKRLKTIKDWSRKFDWVARATEYDAGVEQFKNEERERVLKEGLALDFERIKSLSRMFDVLEEEFYKTDDDGNRPNLWLHDVKSVHEGDNFERVDIFRFNASLIAQLRGVLDDIALEVGGRKKKIEHGTEDGEALPIRLVEVVLDPAVVDDDGSDG